LNYTPNSGETADGKTQRVWEFNLRFNADSSKDEPLPGKAVMFRIFPPALLGVILFLTGAQLALGFLRLQQGQRVRGPLTV